MTTAELRDQLETIALSMERLASVLPPDTDDRLTRLIDDIRNSTAILDFVLPLLRTINPGLTQADLQKDLEVVARILQTVKQSQQNGELETGVKLCRRLESRRLVLSLIARALT